MALPTFPWVVGITPSVGDTDALAVAARAALSAGVSLVVLRAPHLRPQAYAALATSLEGLREQVVLHASQPQASDLSRRLGMGLHWRSGDPLNPQDLEGPMGCSAHGLSALQRAASAGLSYSFLSPIWTPISKPEDQRSPLGLRALGACCGQVSLPVIALGGVTADNAGACVRAGAAGVAAMSAVFPRSLDPGAVGECAAALVRALSVRGGRDAR